MNQIYNMFKGVKYVISEFRSATQVVCIEANTPTTFRRRTSHCVHIQYICTPTYIFNIQIETQNAKGCFRLTTLFLQMFTHACTHSVSLRLVAGSGSTSNNTQAGSSCLPQPANYNTEADDEGSIKEVTCWTLRS